jgi:arylsulfatase A-like enzyme/Flp pilus assembly protein TadD
LTVIPASRRYRGSAAALVLTAWAAGCTREPTPPPQAEPPARNVVLITVDTLRADRVGAYGYSQGRTPALDGLAARGARFLRAFAPAPITLPSHASLLTGRYPPGHGARHNGMRMDEVPTVAETLRRNGFATGAFVAAFPLDRRFGLDRGFDTYGDRMPRVDRRLANERPGSQVVDDAVAWLAQQKDRRLFLWVHLFEPHAPYGRPQDGRPPAARYDDEVAEADRQVGRLVEALAPVRDSTLIVATADHGEAFGEHGEATHSLFVYDTTLRVPLIVAGPGLPARTVEDPVSLVDVAPTILRRLGVDTLDADGVDLTPALTGAALPARALYAESFAPLLDFGWSPLRSLREAGWKLIDAPRPELFNLAEHPDEVRDLSASEGLRVAAMRDRIQRFGPATLTAAKPMDPDAAARLQALGYVGGGRRETSRADPKDRRELAMDLARATSGELSGPALEQALRRILAADVGNPQAHVRLGFVLQESNRCAEAVTHFEAAIAAGLPGADPYLGLAGCQAGAKRYGEAAATLRRADQAERANPVVLANLGIVLSEGGRPEEAVAPLRRALELDPDFHQARFNLAIAFARHGRMPEAAREAEDLLGRLPPTAPQRPEVERLLKSVR